MTFLVSALPIFSRFPFSAWPLVVSLSATVSFLAMGGHRRRDWFHPLVLPMTYVSLVMLGPLLYIQATGRSLLAMHPNALSAETVSMMSATVVLMLGGILVSIGTVGPPLEQTPIWGSWPRLQLIGRLGLALCVVLRIEYAAKHPATQYGRNQLTFDWSASLQSEVDVAILIVVVAIVMSNLWIRKRPLELVDAAGVALYGGASLYTGSRLSIVGPAIFLIWAYHSHVRRLSLLMAAFLGVVVVSGLLLVGILRPTSGLTARSDAVASAFTDLSSPLYVTNEVVNLVPRTHPFLYGRTYLAAMKRQLPGPISNSLFGAPQDTGAYEFRIIEHNFNPNQGFSFALPAEGYLNFGSVGVLSAALLVGLLFGISWRYSQELPSRALNVLYPIVVAALPYGLRSDALTQIKLVLTPMVAIAFVLVLCRPYSATRCKAASVVAKMLGPINSSYHKK